MSAPYPPLLVIDDDPISRAVLGAVLAADGFRVLTAESGEAAIKILEGATETPRAVLADLRMPELGGAELLRELRARTGAPVIAMSASPPRAGENAGADGFLLKPFTADQLRELLAAHADPQTAETFEGETFDNEPVLDTRILAELRALMPEDSVRRIYATAITDLDTRLNELGAAIAGGDATKVKLIGHALKGGCGMIGAMRLSALGKRLETGEGYKSDNLFLLAHQMRAAHADLKNILKVEFSEAIANKPEAL